jgi:hypothetical protein
MDHRAFIKHRRGEVIKPLSLRAQFKKPGLVGFFSMAFALQAELAGW